MTEAVIAIKYYWFVGLPKQGQIDGKVRLIRGDGAYAPAPLWEPEVGVICYNQTIPEWTLLHEAGHARQPWRLAYGIIFGIALAPVEAVAAPVALAWLAMWLCLAAAERHADYHALQRCGVQGLEQARTYFEQQALDQNYLYLLPPDPHLAASTRAFMLHERILQLKAQPAMQPKDVALRPFVWALYW
jgi:hypothetical protein